MIIQSKLVTIAQTMSCFKYFGNSLYVGQLSSNLSSFIFRYKYKKLDMSATKEIIIDVKPKM